MHWLSFFLTLFSSCFLFSCDFHDFDFYQHKLSKEAISQRIEKYLKKDDEIENHYEITAKAFYLYDSLASKKKKVPEFILYFGTKPLEVQKKTKMLKGKKIAIDPGHFGGAFAKLERRFFSFKEIYFDEGSLTFLTAQKLKSFLETAGAEVFLTREAIGKGACELNFYEWKQQNPFLKGSDKVLFHEYYNRMDLYERAKKINQFCPDLTLVIHYNADEIEGVFTQKNYNLVFIPGGFRKKELLEKEARYEFVRLLVRKDIEESAFLGKCLIEKFQQQLQVKSVSKEDKLSYLEAACLKVGHGIYSRNLALTRLIHSPVCYGETFCQNHIWESKRLNLKGKQKTPQRIEEVAKAYFDGVLSFFEQKSL